MCGDLSGFLEHIANDNQQMEKQNRQAQRQVDFPGAKGGTRQAVAHGRQAQLCRGHGQRQALWEVRLCQGPRAAGSGGGVQT
jgi:hypothetical protein